MCQIFIKPLQINLKIVNNLYMSQTDLFSLLKGYTLKIKSSYVNIKEFIGFIERYAQRLPEEQTEWNNWKNNAEKTFWEGMNELTESGKCVVVSDGKTERVFVSAYCQKQIEEVYADTDRLAPVPFPNEDTLKIKIPDGHARKINLVKDLDVFFNQSGEDGYSREIVLLFFPHSYGSALLISSMIPRKLMEISLLKIRYYLHSQNNKEYVLNKLSIQMPGKEKINKDVIEKIMIRPLDCLSELERSADFQYLFWTYFCSLIKNDIKKKNEILSEDLSVLQAVCVIEVCCSIYRNRESKKRDIELAFRVLENNLDKSPWYYTLEDITAFTNDRGILLLDIYTQQELEEYIKKQITEKDEEALPPWFVIHTSSNVRLFLKKERYLHICNKMLIESQLGIKNAIVKRWKRLMKDFSKEKSMESDSAFEKLLENQLKAQNPDLFLILSDPKLQWAFQEMDKTASALHKAAKIFGPDGLLPYSTLLSIIRKDLLSTIKLSFPFWYSIPILSSIIIFFKKLVRKKRASNETGDNEEIGLVQNESSEIKKNASLLESAMIPQGKNIDDYLNELSERWSQIIDKKARENLITDVQSLLYDSLRQAMKIYKLQRITRESLHDICETLLKRHSNLRKLKNQKDLITYMEVYMIKILLTVKKL